MMTFITDPSLTRNARCLDRKRLGKQRVECLQIFIALHRMRLRDMGQEFMKPSLQTWCDADGESPRIGWSTHPAVLMWQGYEAFLSFYYNTIVMEWIGRGYKHFIDLKAYQDADRICGDLEIEMPPEEPEFDKLKRVQLFNADCHSAVTTNPSYDIPWWWQDTETKWSIIESHRASLERKDHDWYTDPHGPCGYWAHGVPYSKCGTPMKYYWPTDVRVPIRL